MQTKLTVRLNRLSTNKLYYEVEKRGDKSINDFKGVITFTCNKEKANEPDTYYVSLEEDFLPLLRGETNESLSYKFKCYLIQRYKELYGEEVAIDFKNAADAVKNCIFELHLSKGVNTVLDESLNRNQFRLDDVKINDNMTAVFDYKANAYKLVAVNKFSVGETVIARYNTGGFVKNPKHLVGRNFWVCEGVHVDAVSLIDESIIFRSSFPESKFTTINNSVILDSVIFVDGGVTSSYIKDAKFSFNTAVRSVLSCEGYNSNIIFIDTIAIGNDFVMRKEIISNTSNAVFGNGIPYCFKVNAKGRYSYYINTDLEYCVCENKDRLNVKTISEDEWVKEVGEKPVITDELKNAVEEAKANLQLIREHESRASFSTYPFGYLHNPDLRKDRPLLADGNTGLTDLETFVDIYHNNNENVVAKLYADKFGNV